MYFGMCGLVGVPKQNQEADMRCSLGQQASGHSQMFSDSPCLRHPPHFHLMKYMLLLRGSVTLQATKRGWKYCTSGPSSLFSFSNSKRRPWTQRRNPYSSNWCNLMCIKSSYVHGTAKTNPPYFSTISGPGGQLIWSAAPPVHSSLSSGGNSCLEDNTWRISVRLR